MLSQKHQMLSQKHQMRSQKHIKIEHGIHMKEHEV
jgi:hypothetical protein